MLSPAFRVRDFDVQDVTSYPIKLTWDSVGGEDSGLVFAAGLLYFWFSHDVEVAIFVPLNKEMVVIFEAPMT